MKFRPLARLLNWPTIGKVEMLLMRVNTVPTGNVPVPLSTKVKETLLLIRYPESSDFSRNSGDLPSRRGGSFESARVTGHRLKSKRAIGSIACRDDKVLGLSRIVGDAGPADG